MKRRSLATALAALTCGTGAAAQDGAPRTPWGQQSRFGVGYLNGLSDENLRVVERFTRTDADTIMYRATIQDPTVFTSTWTVEIPLSPSEGPIFEVACHEGNLGLANILSGHRAEERAAAGR